MPSWKSSNFVLFLIFISLVSSETSHRLYKRLTMNANVWKIFIHKTINFDVETLVECGANCNYFNENCDMFILQSDTTVCYIGTFENGQQNYLSSPEGDHPVHLNLGKLMQNLEETYSNITLVQDETIWQEFIYKSSLLEEPADALDCSFICRNVEKSNGCDLFVMENQVCYVGKSGYINGNIDINLPNVTLYATPTSLSHITASYHTTGLKDNVPSFQWGGHLEQSHYDNIESQLECQALAVLEQWHYSVYDESQNICYFGIMKTENVMALDDENPRQVSINTDQLDQFVTDSFVTRESDLYYHYTYSRFDNPKNIEHCSIHCYLDPEDKCDFFFIDGSYCYLGNFNQVSYVYHLTHTVTTYINKVKVSDMIEKLYPTSVDVQMNKLTTRIREKVTNTVSELECGAHAALAPIDYWLYLDGDCYLGDIPMDSTASGDETKYFIRIRIDNAWSDIDSRFDEKFTLSSYIWTKYIFETHPLESGQDKAECGVRCELSNDHCDFFTVTSGNCYLGRYNNWGQGIVEDPNTPITYHKSGQSAPYIYDPNYYSFGDTYSWAKWIYKYEHSSQASFRKCNFECYHDSSCDFFVDVHSHCCYGRYSYTGSQILSWTNNVAIHVKNGHTPEESMITSNYKDYYGSKDYTNSHFSWWPYGIWGHYSNIPSETMCAFKCLVNRVESCSYYFWGNGHCQVGHYNYRGHNLYGDYDGNTKYMVRNDLNIEHWMREYVGSSSGGSCWSTGYHTLTNHWQGVTITSGGGGYSGYSDYEWCYWAFYAPGAQHLRFEMKRMRAAYGDYVQVFVGTGREGFYALYLHGDRGSDVWTYDAEFFQIFWHANHYETDDGFRAIVRRVG